MIRANQLVMNANHNLHTTLNSKPNRFRVRERVNPAKHNHRFISEKLIAVKPEMISKEGKEERP